jgi:hypothetical protein
VSGHARKETGRRRREVGRILIHLDTPARPGATFRPMSNATVAAGGIVNPAGDLTRRGAYLLAAEADSDLRTVLSEWSRWRVGQIAQGSARERIRRVAEALGARPPDCPETGRGSGPEAA